MRLIRPILAGLLGLVLAWPAAAFETSARAAYVVDVTTGTVLLNKNADTPLPPASMSKLMTLYVAFEAVRSGRLSLDERLPVSQHAMSYGGSTMFLDTTDRVRVEDLLRGLVVLSGTAASAVMAAAPRLMMMVSRMPKTPSSASCSPASARSDVRNSMNVSFVGEAAERR